MDGSSYLTRWEKKNHQHFTFILYQTLNNGKRKLREQRIHVRTVWRQFNQLNNRMTDDVFTILCTPELWKQKTKINEITESSEWLSRFWPSQVSYCVTNVGARCREKEGARKKLICAINDKYKFIKLKILKIKNQKQKNKKMMVNWS